ncbi:MAG: B12-binding domain-containing radical SAM protein [Nitrospirota bacterium]
MTPSHWDVEIIDARLTPIDYNKKVDLVGITAFTTEIPSAYKIAERFRKKGVKVVIGGIHVSALPEEGIKYADSVVIGEAESTWKKLIQDFEKGELKPIYCSNSLINMKGMPIPRRELLDRSMYASCFNTVQATRGCPYNCEYCAVTAFFGNKFRTRPIFEVINEIMKFDTKYFFFVDDNIIGKPEYAKTLFKELIPLKRVWGGQTTINIAKDEELLSLYAKSGGKYAFIGFETLSEKNLKKMNKSWNSPDAYKDAIKRIHKAGINILASFIFGLDDDDATVFKNTYDFIMKNNIDVAQFHILTPFPGTKLYETLDKNGRITDRNWAKYHTGEVVFKPNNMTAEELQHGYWWIFRKTYTIRNIFKRSLRNPRDIILRLAMNYNYRKKGLKMPDVKL